MSEETFMGVPRSKILWCPTIDYEKCDFCMECDEFCPHGVFERRDGEEKKLVVAHPENCVVFCRVCEKACGPGALSFPDKKETTGLIKRLRKKEAAPVQAGDFSVEVSFREFAVDKFIFKVPQSDYYFNDNDCWARIEGARARIGVSDYVQQSASDMVFFEPPEIGRKINIFDEAGSLESTKTALDIISPVSGTVIAVNRELVDAPELVNLDPYVKGWAAEIELTNFKSDLELLMDCAGYFEHIKRKVEKEFREKFGD